MCADQLIVRIDRAAAKSRPHNVAGYWVPRPRQRTDAVLNGIAYDPSAIVCSSRQELAEAVRDPLAAALRDATVLPRARLGSTPDAMPALVARPIRPGAEVPVTSPVRSRGASSYS